MDSSLHRARYVPNPGRAYEPLPPALAACLGDECAVLRGPQAPSRSASRRAVIMATNGLCECGCGGRTSVAEYGLKRLGWIKGQPKRFISGHNSRGANNVAWRGGRKRHQKGYILVWAPDHPRADRHGCVYEHVLIAQQVLGKPLPAKAQVHHVNGVKDDNRHCNLVVCHDAGYHSLLHVRTRALRQSGNANWRRCGFCRRYDDPSRLAWVATRNLGRWYHHTCAAAAARRRRYRTAA